MVYFENSKVSLITIYKSSARPHLDYGDIIYDQTFNESFHQRIESIQYNAALDRDICNSDSLNIFKLSLLKLAGPVANRVFDINNPYGLKLLTRLHLCLSHLCYHKFRHNFQDCINPICDCGLRTETTTCFLLHCPLFESTRQSLLMNIKKIEESILKKHDELITKTLLYGDDKLDLSCNNRVATHFLHLNSRIFPGVFLAFPGVILSTNRRKICY